MGHWSIELLLWCLKIIGVFSESVTEQKGPLSKLVCFIVHEPSIPQVAILLPSSR